MQQKIRVAPRNIQFKDSVQIREIPSRNVGDKEDERRESWDPNLAEVRILICFLCDSYSTFFDSRKFLSKKNQPNNEMLSLLLPYVDLF